MAGDGGAIIPAIPASCVLSMKNPACCRLSSEQAEFFILRKEIRAFERGEVSIVPVFLNVIWPT